MQISFLSQRRSGGVSITAPSYDPATRTATAQVPAGATVTMLVNGASVGAATVTGTTAAYTFGSAPAAGSALAFSVVSVTPTTNVPAASGVPSNALNFSGNPLTFNGDYLTYGAAA